MKALSLTPLLLLLVVACGKSLERQARESLRQLANVNLAADDVEILKVTESANLAIAEVKIRTALKLKKQANGNWILQEVRLGDRRWEKADHLLDALNLRREAGTRDQLKQLAEAVTLYRNRRGMLPPAANFEELVDLLSPDYLKAVVRLDAWSNPFAYRQTGHTFDLRSAGLDGVLNTADDVFLAKDR